MNDEELLKEFGPAKCRGCGLLLRGKAYCLGGQAFHPTTNEQCKVNYYGGYVCSYNCDYKSSLELESSMPGCYGQKNLSYYASESLKRNWRKQ